MLTAAYNFQALTLHTNRFYQVRVAWNVSIGFWVNNWLRHRCGRLPRLFSFYMDRVTGKVYDSTQESGVRLVEMDPKKWFFSWLLFAGNSAQWLSQLNSYNVKYKSSEDYAGEESEIARGKNQDYNSVKKATAPQYDVEMNDTTMKVVSPFMYLNICFRGVENRSRVWKIE